MIRFIRYALATFCFAASVGCLALWWRSEMVRDLTVIPNAVCPQRILAVYSKDSLLDFSHDSRPNLFAEWFVESVPISEDAFTQDRSDDGWFGRRRSHVWFPIWYASLIFGFAGVGILRFRRQFSIRSALVATTVVAALIGMAVIL
jgi:hypothetical protein